MHNSSPADSEETSSPSSSCTLEHNSRETFEYKELDRSADSFRLIQVLPSRSSDGWLQLTLWHDAVSSASYRCLSYRWGDQADHHTVLLNGKLFTVGENLHCFLEEAYARNQKHSEALDGALWIDSICINQASPRERGHQVQRMGNIYAGATGVLVWLGEQSISDELHDWLHNSVHSHDSSPWFECSEAVHDQWIRLRCNQYWHRAWM